MTEHLETKIKTVANEFYLLHIIIDGLLANLHQFNFNL